MMKKHLALLLALCALASAFASDAMAPHWNYDNRKCLISTPLVYNGKLYVSGRNPDKVNEGAVFEFNPVDGKLLRTIPFPREGQNGPYSGFSSPVIVNGMLLHAWESIQAFDLATGKRKWGITGTGRIYGTPVITDDKIIFAGAHKLFAVDFEGNRLWETEIGAECAAQPATDGEKIYIGDQKGFCHAFDVKTGKEAWKFATEKSVRAKPVVYLGLVVFCSFDGSINALGKNNGALRWRLYTRKMVFGNPVLAGQTLYVTDSAGMLRAYEVHTGICKYEAKLPDWGSSGIAFYDNKLYLGDYAGNAMVIDAKNGNLIRNYKFKDWIRATPAICDNQVIFASMDGHLAAFDR